MPSAHALWRQYPSSAGLRAAPRKQGGLGAPAPTFLHQLLVNERAAHDQQHRQEHEGQEDAGHGACVQARRVWILAWGGRGVRSVPPWASKLPTQRQATGWHPPEIHQQVWKAVICLAVSPHIHPPSISHPTTDRPATTCRSRHQLASFLPPAICKRLPCHHVWRLYVIVPPAGHPFLHFSLYCATQSPLAWRTCNAYPLLFCLPGGGDDRMGFCHSLAA